jgi:phosphatidylglycerol:prolipoprotein diacylglycerol transferase
MARFCGARFRPGLITGVFLIGYGAARSFVELFRQPDLYVGDAGFLAGGVTMGQLLSAPIVIAGVAFIVYAVRHERIPDRPGRAA